MTALKCGWWIFKVILFFFFFNDTATTEIYTLSLHELFRSLPGESITFRVDTTASLDPEALVRPPVLRCVNDRSEEHTSELQSQSNLVCRLLLEKKHIPLLPIRDFASNADLDISIYTMLCPD